MSPDVFFKDSLMLEAVIGPVHSSQKKNEGEHQPC